MESSKVITVMGDVHMRALGFERDPEGVIINAGGAVVFGSDVEDCPEDSMLIHDTKGEFPIKEINAFCSIENTTIEYERKIRGASKSASIESLAKDGSLLPQIVGDYLEATEVTFCELMSGGQDQVKAMPRMLELTKLRWVEGSLKRYSGIYNIGVDPFKEDKVGFYDVPDYVKDVKFASNPAEELIKQSYDGSRAGCHYAMGVDQIFTKEEQEILDKTHENDVPIDRSRCVENSLSGVSDVNYPLDNYRQIKDINDLDDSPMGKLLLAAIAKITTESQTTKTPPQVLAQLVELADHMYAPNKEEE